MRLMQEPFAHFAYHAGWAHYGAFAAARRLAPEKVCPKALRMTKQGATLATMSSTFDAPRASYALTAASRPLKSPNPSP
jgi:hypothetical protein